MKKCLLFGGLLLATGSFSQTVIFEDNFELETFNWSLNTIGQGSSENEWTINGSYAGSDDVTPVIGDVPAQPASFDGGINSQYLHIMHYPTCSSFVPVTCNANFSTNAPTNEAVEMTYDLNTVDADNVTLSFWYLCNGAAGVSYGVVEYSVDNGMTWAQAGAQLSGVTAWTQIEVLNPVFDDQEGLRFRFRWVNGATGSNQPFSIDEIVVTTEHETAAEIFDVSVTGNDFCSNSAIDVTFEATGSIGNGNQYRAELSDASGSFATPFVIGTLNSSASGTITIPGTPVTGVPAGTGYRVRVTSLAPALTSADNGIDIEIKTAPTVVADPVTNTICLGSSLTLLASGADTYTWEADPTLNTTSGASVIATPVVTTTYHVEGTAANGCADTASVTITVEDCAGIADLSGGKGFTVFPNPAASSFALTYTGSELLKSVRLLDLNGRVVKNFQITGGTYSIAEIPAGTYLLQAVFEAHTSTQSLVIQ
jgi:hypothetical protein